MGLQAQGHLQQPESRHHSTFAYHSVSQGSANVGTTVSIVADVRRSQPLRVCGCVCVRVIVGVRVRVRVCVCVFVFLFVGDVETEGSFTALPRKHSNIANVLPTVNVAESGLINKIWRVTLDSNVGHLVPRKPLCLWLRIS